MGYGTLIIAFGIVIGIGFWSRRKRLKFKPNPKKTKHDKKGPFSSRSKRSTKLRRVK